MSSGATSPALAPASIDMLQTVIRPSIDIARNASPRYSMTWPSPPPVPIVADDRQHDVLRRRHPTGSAPVDVDRHPTRPHLRQRLRCQHVLDLARADAEGEGAEGTMGGRVAVAADDRHARQGAPLLRPDDVDDALAGIAHRVVGDAELGGVADAAPRPASPTPRRRSAGRCRSSGRCGPRWRRSARDAGHADQTGAAPRTPAGW